MNIITDSLDVSLQNQYNQSSTKTKKEPIYLNIYNFSSCFNRFCSCCGIGVYHTGIEIHNEEYMFFGFDGDQTGVGYLLPQTAAYQFKEQMILGYTDRTIYQIDREVLDPLRLEFLGNKYDLLNNNCNHFSKRCAEQMGATSQVPQYIFAVTDFFNRCRCCLPKCILDGSLSWFNFGEENKDYKQIQESLNVSFHHETSR